MEKSQPYRSHRKTCCTLWGNYNNRYNMIRARTLCAALCIHWPEGTFR
jgi:hypothetical protein